MLPVLNFAGIRMNHDDKPVKIVLLRMIERGVEPYQVRPIPRVDLVEGFLAKFLS